MPSLTFIAPFGPLEILAKDEAILALHSVTGPAAENFPKHSLLREAKRQLTAYFSGRLFDFDLPVAPKGTPFQQKVWQEMRRIPYGETASYGDLAAWTGSGPRAIGGACGHNRIAIIIPCHRVVASGGKIGGFSAPGGTNTKKFLLQLEAARLAA